MRVSKKIKAVFDKYWWVFIIFLFSTIYAFDFMRNDIKFKVFLIGFILSFSILCIYFFEEEKLCYINNPKKIKKIYFIKYSIGILSCTTVLSLKYGFSIQSFGFGFLIGILMVIIMPILKYMLRLL